MDIKRLKTDVKKTNEGVWCQVDGDYDWQAVVDLDEAKQKLIEADKKGELDKGDYFFIRVARIGGIKYKQFRNSLSKAKLKQIRKGNLSPTEEEAISLRATAHGVLLDWDWMFDGEEPVPYSSETAFEYLHDPDFVAVVGEIAEEREIYMQDALKEASKN